jgi:hypothetical protein
MCGGDQDWSPAEIDAFSRHMRAIGADAMLEGWLAEHEAWKARPPEPILSDEQGAAILADPCAYGARVPGGFRVWTLKQVDGAALWAGWLEEIRKSQIAVRGGTRGN